MARRGALSGALLLLACGTAPTETASFPADYASTYQEVRACRPSSDHDLNRIRVLADPAALEAYRKRDRDFPVGAIVLKEQYDLTDTSCSGPIVRWTSMERLAAGSSPRTLDWRWAGVDAERRVVEKDGARCYDCHAKCTPGAGGYLSTCTVP